MKIYNIDFEKKFIENHLGNFDDFMELLDIRRDIRKTKGENYLGNFYILNGRYWIDQFGQISKVTQGLDELKKFFDIPLVMTDEEFSNLMCRYNEKINAITPEEHKKLNWDEISKLHESGRPYGIGVTRSMGASLPDKNTHCPYCGKGWDINNVDDCLHHNSTWKSYPIKEKDLHGDVLYDFVGQPLKNFWKFFEMKTNAVYYPMTDRGINNPKWINNNPDPKYPTLKINSGGYYKDKIDENYILQEGDEVNFQVVECFHKDCNRKFLYEKELERFQECFEKAGFSMTKFFPIPNEYCNDPDCTICSNWFDVKTKWGIIKIGWRKRVINIDWSKIGEVNGLAIFSDQDVTKNSDSIHAWGWEKCVEYLIKLRESFEKNLQLN
jgi:hypothetical protein